MYGYIKYVFICNFHRSSEYSFTFIFGFFLESADYMHGHDLRLHSMYLCVFFVLCSVVICFVVFSLLSFMHENGLV